MAQSANELKIIHTRSLATPGKKYYGDDDNVYIGTSEGRLKLLDKALQVVTTNNSNVQNVISENKNEIDQIELELQSSSLLKFKKFTYDVDGNITQKEVFEDSTEAVKLFDVVFSYTGQNLSNIEITRMSDSYTYNKELTYDSNDNVQYINII